MKWLPINTAPKDGRVILVNCTRGYGSAPWAAARWLPGAEWSGWIYDDEQLQDSEPLGPEPTHWLDVPPLQEAAHCGERSTHFPLPDSLFPNSKDWMHGNYASRVEWLYVMYTSCRDERERLMVQLSNRPAENETPNHQVHGQESLNADAGAD